jgi:hypothetical protein
LAGAPPAFIYHYADKSKVFNPLRERSWITPTDDGWFSTAAKSVAGQWPSIG